MGAKRLGHLIQWVLIKRALFGNAGSADMVRVMLNTSQVLISGAVGIERAKSYTPQYEGKTQKSITTNSAKVRILRSLHRGR